MKASTKQPWTLDSNTHLQKLANQSKMAHLQMVIDSFGERWKNFGRLIKRRTFYSKKYIFY